MFSVDNFYDLFYADYGWEKTKNIIMIFQPHGSKDLHNLEPFGPIKHDPTDLDKIIMHDQEPLFLSYLDTYRRMIAKQKKSSIVAINTNQIRKAESIANYPENISNIGIFKRAASVKNPSRTIICHSELNSDDIRILEADGFVSCYYWWHGMISRDWFRHWQHYKDLQPIDKSSAKYRFLLYSRDHTGTREYRKELVSHCRRYQNQILHNWHGDQVDSTYSAKIDICDAVDSAVHIVAETLFDTNKIYLTEKVFKPMVMSQPFILFAPPKSLQYLRDYGFRTFDGIWDESYDLETNSIKRMESLLTLVTYLAGLSQSKFRDLYVKSLSIIEHNRQRFFSSEFQDHLISEMRNNVNQALFEQNQCHQHSLNNKSSTDGHDV